MPTYQITSPNGQKLQVTGDTPPSEAELDQIFSKVAPSATGASLQANQSGPLAPGETRSPAPVQPQQPQDSSLFGKVSSFAKNADDTFMGGILSGVANLTKLVSPSAGQKVQDYLNQNIIKPDANPTPAGQAGKTFGGLEKGATELVGSLAAPEVKAAQEASAAEKALALLGRVGVNAATGGVITGSDTGDRTKTAESALISGLMTAGIEGASTAKNAGRNAFSKTAVGQVFGNTSKDVTAGILNKGNDYIENSSDYMKFLNQAEAEAPDGVPAEGIINNVTGNTATKDKGVFQSFKISGAGPAGNYALPKDDQEVLQKVVDYASGSTTFKNPGELQSALHEAQQVAQAYGIDITIPKKDLQQVITEGVNNAYSVRKYAKDAATPLDQIATAMSKDFQPVLQTNGHIPLDFSKSVFKNDQAAQSRINTIWQDMGEVMNGGTASVSELDSLKQRIGEEVKKAAPAVGQQPTQELALLSKMYSTVEKSITDVSPSYQKSMDAYKGYKAGQEFKNIIPGGSALMKKVEAGGAGTVLAAGAFMHNPLLALSSLLASPKLEGTALRAAGSANRAAGAVTVPIAKAVKNTPVGASVIAKILESLQ